MTFMKLGFITDTHDDPRAIPWLEAAVKKYDVVCVGGDLGRTLLESITNFVIKNDNTFMVFGNHDYVIANHPRIFNGTKTRYHGITIGGMDGSLPVGGWPDEHDETEYLIMCENMGPVDILLLHQPPKNTNVDVLYNGSHVGSVAVREYIEKTQPLLAVSGHIHESPGVDKIGKTVIANPGAFVDTGNYLEASITKKTASVKLCNGPGPIRL